MNECPVLNAVRELCKGCPSCDSSQQSCCAIPSCSSEEDTMIIEDMRVEYMNIEDLTSQENNPRHHDLEAIGASMRRFGYVEPMVLDETSGRLVVGDGRRQQLLLEKATGGSPPAHVRASEDGWFAPVLRGLHFSDSNEARAYGLASNRVAERGQWDDALLIQSLSELATQDNGLDGTGFGDDDLDTLIAYAAALEEGMRNEADIEAKTRPPDPPAEKQTRTRQTQAIWRIVVLFPGETEWNEFRAMFNLEWFGGTTLTWQEFKAAYKAAA